MIMDNLIIPSTNDKITNAVVEICEILFDTIHELKRVPSGHLYAQLSGKMSLDFYLQLLDILRHTGHIQIINHELICRCYGTGFQITGVRAYITKGIAPQPPVKPSYTTVCNCEFCNRLRS